MIERAAAGADLEIKARPHMLCHACGYAPKRLGDLWSPMSASLVAAGTPRFL
jgi:hypothetical protein